MNTVDNILITLLVVSWRLLLWCLMILLAIIAAMLNSR